MMCANEGEGQYRWYWDMHSRWYDKPMRFLDRALFKDSRDWACGQAVGDVLEVAIGTGLNIGAYSDSVALTGIDFSEAMLEAARARAEGLGRAVELLRADAQSLPFPDGSFDTAVCTFGMCAIPNPAVAIGEMKRVVRPGGSVILVDHIVSSRWVVRAGQRVLNAITAPLFGEHFLRRPLVQVAEHGLVVEQVERFGSGVVERLVARKPSAAS